MARFIEAEFYHTGLSEWIKALFNTDRIEMVQPDHKGTDMVRVWQCGDQGEGLLTRLTWDEARAAVAAVQK